MGNEALRKIKFKSCGFDCVIHEQSVGHLTGYVGVKQGHPLYGEHYNEMEQIDVHGGVTFAAHHLKDEDNSQWWIGMDCAHTELGDIVPRMTPGLDMIQRTYAMFRMIGGGLDEKPEGLRDEDFVRKELQKLARQLRALAPKTPTTTPKTE